jgi:hypothetical protein
MVEAQGSAFRYSDLDWEVDPDSRCQAALIQSVETESLPGRVTHLSSVAVTERLLLATDKQTSSPTGARQSRELAKYVAHISNSLYVAFDCATSTSYSPTLRVQDAG